MSERFQGGVITKTAVTPSGPYQSSTAPGIWTLNEAAQFTKLSLWPTAGNYEYWVTFSNENFGGSSYMRMSANNTAGVYLTGGLTGASEGGLLYLNTSGTLQYVTRFWRSPSCCGSSYPYAIAGDIYGRSYSTNQLYSVGTFVVQIDKLANRSDPKLNNNIGTTDLVLRQDTVQIRTGWSSGNIRVQLMVDSTFIAQCQTYITADASGNRRWPLAAADSSNNIYIASTNIDAALSGYIVRLNPTLTAYSTVTRKLSVSSGGGGINLSSIVVDSSDNVFVCGYQNGTPSRVFVIKYDSSGGLLWARTLDSTSTQARGNNRFLTTDTSGNVYAFFQSNTTDAPSFIVKYNSSGTLQWQRQFRRTAGTYALQPVGISVSGSYMYVVHYLESSNYPFIWKLPIDGSLTGSYTMPAPLASYTFAYEASSYTDSAYTFTDASAGAWTVTSTAYALSGPSPNWGSATVSFYKQGLV